MINTENGISIDGSSLNLKLLERISRGGEVSLGKEVKERVDHSRQFVEKVAKGKAAAYGINTGFGYFARSRISEEERDELQVNLLRSHSAGHGTPLSIPESRAALALRLNVLTRGHAGVRYQLCELMLELLKRDICPVIPELGSVGASGDLAPLSHLALSLIGEGDVFYKGNRMPAADALAREGLEPITLKDKEGLSLVNGTQIMLAVGGLALADGTRLLKQASQVTALSYEGLRARLTPLDPLIHESRGQKGQIAAAHEIYSELEGSYLHTLEKRQRLQDPYSLRCAPQVHGPAREALEYAIRVVEVEMNSSTDNPLVFTDEEKILSGGNFHGEPLAFAFDFACMGLAELGNISERRLELLMNPHMSGLPAFLAKKEGLCSGYMSLQYLSASLVNQNKINANPACTDSIPGNVGVEDFVSMGMTSARKLRSIVKNLRVILAAELLAAAQAIDLLDKPKLGSGTTKLYEALREKVPPLETDRIVERDVNAAVEVLQNYL